MTFTIHIAEMIVHIESVFSGVYEMCSDFLISHTGKANINIIITSDMLKIAYNKQLIQDGYAPSPNQIEKMLVYQIISEAFLSFSTFLMHGAVIATNQSAFMFTAESGLGKSTHIQKWLENAPNVFVVNGDKPLIKLTDTEAIAYGTPWCGKERLGTDIGVPLRAIVLMERSENNEIEEITFSQAFPTLLQQTYRPADANKMRKTLTLLSGLNGKMKFYRFRFNNMKPDAFRTSYEALTGKKIDSDEKR